MHWSLEALIWFVAPTQKSTSPPALAGRCLVKLPTPPLILPLDIRRRRPYTHTSICLLTWQGASKRARPLLLAVAVLEILFKARFRFVLTV